MAEPEASDWEGRPAPSNMLWSLWVDVPITRRKRYALVVDPHMNVAFRSMLVSEALQFLEDGDITAWRLCTEHKTFGINRQWCISKGT